MIFSIICLICPLFRQQNHNTSQLIYLLQKYFDINKRDIFNQLKGTHSSDTLKKSLILTRLFHTQQGRYSEAFKIWSLHALYLRREARKEATQRVFEVLSDALQNNLSLLYQNNLENKLKAQVIR